MAREEAQPKNLDESPKLTSSQRTTPAPSPSTVPAAVSQFTPFPVKKSALGHDGTTPSLPPQMASVRSHTADEIVQMMNQTPLFMTSLEEAGEGA